VKRSGEHLNDRAADDPRLCRRARPRPGAALRSAPSGAFGDLDPACARQSSSNYRRRITPRTCPLLPTDPFAQRYSSRLVHTGSILNRERYVLEGEFLKEFEGGMNAV
jgi:hypothetical protein